MPRRYHGRGRRGRWPALRAGGALSLAVAVLAGLFALPATLTALATGNRVPAVSVPLELLLAAALAALWADREGRLGGGAIRRGAAVVLTVLLALQGLAAATQAILGRPFLLAFDLPLAASAVEFVAGTYGTAAAVSAAVAVALALPAAYAVIVFCFGRVQVAMRRGGWAIRMPVLLACGAAVAVQIGHWTVPDQIAPSRIVSDRSARNLAAQGRAIAVRFADQSRYSDGPQAPARPPVGLGGADVLLFMLESYGRSSIEDPRYGPTIVPSLRGAEAGLRARGFAAVSGWLESPTFGGQSWLAHASLLSGLRVDNQFRYKLLLSGKRRTLVDDFEAAGYRTVLLEPAIDRPWPEVAFYGFDRTYFSRDMNYAGPPYDWVTMPDQYSLAFLDRTERRRETGPPLFAVTVLISSHAPWTPVAQLVEDWSAIGDGRIFAAWAGRGEPPELVWSYPEKVRRQYARAMDYVIDVLGSYFRRFDGDRPTLAILVGDHQPAPIVSGANAGHDVPIHVVSNDPALLRPFRDWGLVDGMVPAADGESRPMEAFRDWFLTSFGGAAVGSGTAEAPDRL